MLLTMKSRWQPTSGIREDLYGNEMHFSPGDENLRYRDLQ